jgi:hypothetical protein
VGSELQLRLSHRRAVTADFERLVCSSAASAGGSNVSAQQKVLSELHAESGDRTRAGFLRYQHEVRGPQRAVLVAENDPQQPQMAQPHGGTTMAEAWVEGLLQPENPSAHLSVPSKQWCRMLFLNHEQAGREYCNRWREQFVSALILQLDYSLKVLKCKLLKNRLTIMNEIGQVLLSVNVASTSFGDIGALLAFEALRSVLEQPGRPKIKLIFLDAPMRDGPGARKALGVELVLDSCYQPTIDITEVRYDDAALGEQLALVR